VPVREWIFAALLAVAGGLIVVGAAMWSRPAGFVAAGVVLAVWSWDTLSGDSR
jgi:hypothetical protein